MSSLLAVGLAWCVLSGGGSIRFLEDIDTVRISPQHVFRELDCELLVECLDETEIVVGCQYTVFGKLFVYPHLFPVTDIGTDVRADHEPLVGGLVDLVAKERGQVFA